MKIAHFVGLDVLQVAVLAVPGPAEHADVARFDASDVGAPVEVLPVANEGDLRLGEGPVQTQVEPVIDQSYVAQTAGIGPGTEDVDVVVRFFCRLQRP